MKFLITGNGGSGKSTVCGELANRGYSAIDADEADLARWEDAHTGEPVEVDYTKFVDYAEVAWNWHKQKLRNLLETSSDIFVCGSASNQFEFYEFFDKVYVLSPSPEVQRQRLQSRSSEYGKDKKTIDWIIADQKEVVDSSRKMGAIIIDADGSLEETVDDILADAYEG